MCVKASDAMIMAYSVSMVLKHTEQTNNCEFDEKMHCFLRQTSEGSNNRNRSLSVLHENCHLCGVELGMECQSCAM